MRAAFHSQAPHAPQASHADWSPGLDIQKATLALSETLAQQGADSCVIEQALAVWQAFLDTSGLSRLPGSPESWSAAVHYRALVGLGRKCSQKVLSAQYQISMSTLSRRLAVLKRQVAAAEQVLQPAAQVVHPPTEQTAPAAAVNGNGRCIQPVEYRDAGPFDDAGWIAVFRATHRLVSHLYIEKTHVEIVRFLDHVEANLRLAGYAIAPDLIREQFSRLFAQLGLQPAKGRDAEKFVFLQGLWGPKEPFVLLKLEYEDG